MSSGAMQSALSYFSNVLSGYSSNIFKMMPAGKTTNIGANDIVTLTMPSNSIVDLRSFKVYFDASTTGTTARLPPKIDSLIARCEVLAGGVQLAQGTNFYNVLRHVKDSLCQSKTNPVSGHPELIRTIKDLDDTAIGNNPEPLASASQYIGTGESAYCIDYWEGFLGTAEPRFLDLSLLPDLQVRLYFAPNSVLTDSDSSAAGAALTAAEGSAFTGSVASFAATYTVTNLFSTIECISLSDSSYDEMLADQMANQQFLEVPFKAYYVFQQEHTGTSRFQVSTQSLDRIWTTFRYSGAAVTGAVATGRQYPFTAGGPPIPVLGYTPNTPVETRIASGLEKYSTAQFNFQTPAADVNLQWQLNGAFIPQAPMSASELYPFTAHNLPSDDYAQEKLTMCEYLRHRFVSCVRLNFKDSERSRIISGLDTRSSNLSGLMETSNATVTDYNSWIALETTSTLRIEAGRAISVVA